MTPAARQRHIQALKDILQKHGFEEDRWGNYIHPGEPLERFKFKKNNLRLERKFQGRWASGGFSHTMSKIDLDQFDRYIQAKVGQWAETSNGPDIDKKALKRRRWEIRTECVNILGDMYHNGTLPMTEPKLKTLLEELFRINEVLNENKKRMG